MRVIHVHIVSARSLCLILLALRTTFAVCKPQRYMKTKVRREQSPSSIFESKWSYRILGYDDKSMGESQERPFSISKQDGVTTTSGA
jgi:hypothetical protein